MLNINLIENKFQDINFILEKQLVDILVINGSRISSDVNSSRFEINNYKLIRRDRGEDSSGDLLIYLKSNLNCSDIYMDFSSINEIIGFKINFSDFQIKVIGAYRAPDGSEESFFNEIETVSNFLNKKCSETIISGDLNNNVLDPNTPCCLKTFNENNG